MEDRYNAIVARPHLQHESTVLTLSKLKMLTQTVYYDCQFSSIFIAAAITSPSCEAFQRSPF